MANDFHGSEEQAFFEKTMKMVFPDRRIVDIPNDDPIFHTVFDLWTIDTASRVPSIWTRDIKKMDGWRAGKASMTIKAV